MDHIVSNLALPDPTTDPERPASDSLPHRREESAVEGQRKIGDVHDGDKVKGEMPEFSKDRSLIPQITVFEGVPTVPFGALKQRRYHRKRGRRDGHLLGST